MKYKIDYIVEGNFSGPIKIIDSSYDYKLVCEGDVLLIKKPNPDIVLSFGKITGIISEVGGKLSHIAIVSRENNIPCVRLENATNILKNGVVISVRDGFIYVK